ncbi:hypothetical protein KZZ04_19755, partial [Pseudoalteromonas sp. CR1]|nr:hypothetical protein [Pseudoalteromonas sp. CR1]
MITTANAAITVNSSRDVLITGGSNINEAARIDSDANGVLSITTSRDLILTGGSNTNTSAQIQNNAPGN